MFPFANHKEIPGLNVRSPWGQLIVTGEKAVETRSYPLPKKYLGRELAIIETYGNRETRLAQIIGIVIFERCFRYGSRDEWIQDQSRHLVSPDDSEYAFHTSVPKWGWEVRCVSPLSVPQPPPRCRGIIYARSCTIQLNEIDNLG